MRLLIKYVKLNTNFPIGDDASDTVTKLTFAQMLENSLTISSNKMNTQIKSISKRSHTSSSASDSNFDVILRDIPFDKLNHVFIN